MKRRLKFRDNKIPSSKLVGRGVEGIKWRGQDDKVVVSSIFA